MEAKPDYEILLQKLPETFAMVIKVCNDAIYPSDFFEKFPQSKKLVHLGACGVDKDYQRKGIATNLVSKSIEVRFFQKFFINIFVFYFYFLDS